MSSYKNEGFYDHQKHPFPPQKHPFSPQKHHFSYEKNTIFHIETPPKPPKTPPYPAPVEHLAVGTPARYAPVVAQRHGLHDHAPLLEEWQWLGGSGTNRQIRPARSFWYELECGSGSIEFDTIDKKMVVKFFEKIEK
jgi:hypothetical protein